jgi:5-formyltetrahydrofolate cyclo-ligase
MVDRFKRALRQTYRGVRQNLSLEYQFRASNKICTKIRALNQFRYAKRVALYHAMQGEINLESLWQTAPLQGKYCYFPTLKDHTLFFLPATPATAFSANHYGILEPDVEHDLALTPEQIDVIFIPLVGFDEHRTRLGMGAGYYDRALANNKAPNLIGVAYEFQRIGFIEKQPWDVSLTRIITEYATYEGEL